MLNLFDLWGSPIWSSPYKTTTSFSTAAVLLDNGNLVIRDQINNSRVNWQSFDNPTDILLGGRLGFNTITGRNVTLVSYSGYGSMYTLAFDATRRRGFTIQQNSDGPVFAGTFPRWMDIREDGEYVLCVEKLLVAGQHSSPNSISLSSSTFTHKSLYIYLFTPTLPLKMGEIYLTCPSCYNLTHDH
jgi:hypothetical protein